MSGADQSSATVAFIGLGAMGSAMARCLLAAGHRLTVWNRTPDKAQPLGDLGATVARTPAEAAGKADVVMTMLADPPALRAVSEGPQGVIAGVREATTVIEMSTVGPAAVSRLSEALPAGAGLLDAPVLGSVSEAEAGTLHLFVGGPAALFRRWSPLLSALGTPLHVGDLGAGAAAKLVANTTLLGVLGVLGETLALARGLGLGEDAAYEALAATPLAEQARRRRGAVESGDYPKRFALSLARKDADLIVEAASSAGVDMRLLAATRTWFADAEDAGWGERDYSTVLARILG